MKQEYIDLLRTLLVVEEHVKQVRCDLIALQLGQCTLDQFTARLESRIAALETALKLP